MKFLLLRLLHHTCLPPGYGLDGERVPFVTFARRIGESKEINFKKERKKATPNEMLGVA